MGECNSSSQRLFGSAFLNGLFFVIVTLWTLLFFPKVVIGALKLNECNEEEMIPIWLIVDAILPIFFIIGFVIFLKAEYGSSLGTYGCVFIIMATILALGWWICGSLWIYPNRNTGNCDKLVENFAYGMLTFNWCTVWMWANIAGRWMYTHCTKTRS